jgi:17beta-estradiol 17-dehydrogenase / very-long-chain 3-oxoacyl-CoA reductase
MDDKIVTYVIAGVLSLTSFIFFGGCVWTTIFYMGLVRVLLNVWDLGQMLHEHYIMKRLDLAQRYGQGSWAFVTGAANGLGLEYSTQLAKLGFNLVMVDLDQEGLDKSKVDLQKEHKDCEILSVKWNLAQLKDSDEIKSIFETALQKDISIVISNAGITTFDAYQISSPKIVETICSLNATANCLLTAFFYDRLVKRAEAKNVKSALLFTASLAGYAHDGHQIMYSSTKAFLRFFTLSLSEEVDKNVDILSVCPGLVSTNIIKFYDGPGSIDTSTCISGALKCLGQKTETNTSISHHVLRKFMVDDAWNIHHELPKKLAGK